MNRAVGIVLVLVAVLGAGALVVRDDPSIAGILQPPSATRTQPDPAPSDQTQGPSTPGGTTGQEPPAATGRAGPTPAPGTPGSTASPGFDFGRASLENERNTMAIVDRVGPGVVFITTSANLGSAGRVDPNDPFGGMFGFGGQQGGAPQQVPQGNGSGFVIDDSGLILTNNHVVTLDGSRPGSLTVRFHGDSREYPAEVVGRAPAYDIALIRVNAPGKELVPIPLGDSAVVRTGQKAIAMGNPFGLEFTVTEGIVSSGARNIGVGTENFSADVIQTDAAVNPGNSGGPLINSAGEVIGINTQILSPAAQFGGQAQFAGIAFAVPINLVKTLLPDLREGKVLDRDTIYATRPRLGVAIQELSGYPPQVRERYNLPANGVMISSVEPGSPAADAGLRAASNTIQVAQGELAVDGDVITAIDGKSITNSGELQTAVFGSEPGQTVRLTVRRGGQTREVPVTLEVISARR